MKLGPHSSTEKMGYCYPAIQRYLRLMLLNSDWGDFIFILGKSKWCGVLELTN